MPPNVLIIVIDSLRSDKLFGSEKNAKTPILDNLISEGTFFPNNISSADGTVMSWAGMFTALEPLKTGVRSERYNKIDSSILNFFSLIKNEGYRVFGCVPKFATAFGMMKDFENSDKTYDRFQHLSEGLGTKIFSQLSTLPTTEPWLYFLHVNDIHFPIIPPKEFDDSEFGESKYDRTLSSIDFWLGKIFEKVDLSTTLVVITADHGSYVPSVKIGDKWINFETDGSKQKFATKIGNKIPSFLEPVKTKIFFTVEKYRKKTKEKKSQELFLTPYQKRSLFFQRGDIDHFLYDERIKVPLLFLGYGIKSQKIISDQVRTIDIFPTIFDILKLKVHNDNVDGRSLFPLIDGKSLEELPAFIVSSPLIDVESNDVIGLRTSRYKYFRDKDDSNKRVHLFDLQKDPFEENNISKDNPSVIEDMEKLIVQKQSESKSLNSDYSEDELKNIEKELKRMGYI